MSTTQPSPAVILLSGGLDSTTTLAMAADAGQAIHAISFRYGQRHEIELACAERQAQRFGARVHTIVDLSHLGALVAPASSLIGASAIPVPARGSAIAGQIPSTYVPARNTLFLSYALAWAETLDARDIWLGVNAVDYSGYPDCRPEFLSAFEALANLATRVGVEGGRFTIHAPLIKLHKHEIIAAGRRLGVDFADTVSCYDPRVEPGRSEGEPDCVLACGCCESCALRRRGFAHAGGTDPTRYVAE